MRAPVGGLFRHVADLTRALCEHGHDIGLVVDSIASDSQTDEKLAALLPHATLGLHRVPMPRLLGLGDISAPLTVRRLGRQLDINVYHGHGAKGGFYARLALLGIDKPIADYTPHGGVLHYPPRSSTGRIFHFLERALMRKTSAIIFESAYAQRTYAAVIGSPNCPTNVIHNGLTPEEFVPVAANADAADFVFVGELRGLKGIVPLVEALAKVKRADGLGATLVMAGDGPERQALKSRIAGLGLTDRVELAGVQPARAMFARGRIAIVPSLAESLPYVVLEAAAAQLPVISTRVGGIAEIFGPTASSLIPAGDVAALATAMQGALDNPAAALAEMRTRLDHVSANFSLKRMANDIEALYLRLAVPVPADFH